MKQQIGIERTSRRFLLIVIMGLVGVLLLLAILLSRYVSLHNAFLDKNAEILDEVDDLQETTNQLQETIDSLLTITTNETIPADDLAAMDQLLDQIGEDLIDIEDTIEESSFYVVDETEQEQVNNSIPLSNEANVEDIQNDINQTFTLIAWLMGGISLITAVLLTITLNIRYSSKRRRKRMITAGMYPTT